MPDPAGVETHVAVFTPERAGQFGGNLAALIGASCEAVRASLCSQARAERRPGSRPQRLDPDDMVPLSGRHAWLESLTTIILNYKPGECAHSSLARQLLSACDVPHPASLAGPGPSVPPLSPLLSPGLHVSSGSSEE